MLLMILFIAMGIVGTLCIWFPQFADKLIRVFFTLGIALFVSAVVLVLGQI